MQRIFKITVNGTDYDVAVEELSVGTSQLMPNYTPAAPVIPGSYAAPVPVPSQGAAPAASAAPVPAGSGDQCAQMGGVVASIFVKEGQSIGEGERIMELEAMKMKVPVMSSCAGKISRLHVRGGEAVQSGQVLATIS